MSGAKLVKLVPTLILVGLMGYSVYAIQSGLPGAAETRAEVQKGLGQMVQDMVTDGSGAAAKLEVKLRDPFWVAVAAPAHEESPAQDQPDSPERDTLAEVVRGLSLDATFLQGRDQLAVINGRIYSRGQRLDIPGGDPTSDQALRVLVVTRTGVLLTGGGRHYSLGYPDQLGKRKDKDGESGASAEQAGPELDPGGQMEMFQRLLNSPLGAMGKSLIGNVGSADRRTGAAAKSTTRGRPDARARRPRAAGP
jgi:hypothetical protein